jgi:hypothetical protein
MHLYPPEQHLKRDKSQAVCGVCYEEFYAATSYELPDKRRVCYDCWLDTRRGLVK